MDEVERIMRMWLSDICTCRGISEGRHKPGCPNDGISDADIDWLCDEVYLWHDAILYGEVEDAVKEALKPPAEPPHIVEDDPE